MTTVIMGVSGAGKSVLGAALARELRVPFRDGDDLHPAINRARMAAGIALDDQDRAPWLEAVAAWMHEHPDGVIACSALKRRYRDRLRVADLRARFVLLAPPEAELRRRLAGRTAHFMPATLLDSQLRALEPPGTEERALTVAAVEPVAATVRRVLRWLGGGRDEIG